MPVRMTSEKFIRAERRNRLENHRLNVTCKHYDRANIRLNYDIDREKRSITKAFRTVIKTSGASDVGLPPKNEKDTDFERCPTYMQGLKLSNKRLLEWRECEKQLNKFIMHHEMEVAKENQKKVTKMLKENVEIPQSEKDETIEDDVFGENDVKSNGHIIKVSPVDILKDDPENKNEVFDVKKWEKEIMESYKTMVSRPDSEHNSSQDVYETKENLRSKSSPAFSMRTTEIDNGYKRVRPHTAHADPRRRPTSGKPLPKRPLSANVKSDKDKKSTFLITKESTFIKNGHKFEKLLDSRPIDTPVLVNNYLNSLMLPGPGMDKEPSISSGNSLCPVREDNEDDFEDDSVANSKGLQYETSNLNMVNLQRRKKHKHKRAQSATSVTSNSTHRSTFKHSNSDLSSFIESNRRSRRDSESMSSVIMSRTGSIVSSHMPSASLGIPSDIEEISRGQDKLMSEISPDKPLSTNKLVSISKVVKAAMTISRLARKRALQRMQEENSTDSHELIRRERLRKLQSRQNVLNCITQGWQSDADAAIEQVE